MKEKAYSYRSFEHFKRETYALIASIAENVEGPIRMADISCGPAVLEGILLGKFNHKIQEVHLLDIEQGFLDTAKEYLAEFNTKVITHVFDLNAPGDYPLLKDLNLIISTNGIFHASSQSLPKLYKWCYESLGTNGLLINQQTFGGQFSPGLEKEFEKACASLHPKMMLDDLDIELMRRSHHDTTTSGGPVNQEQGGGYEGLPMTVFQHLEILQNTGFQADEIWRKGTSAMVLAIKGTSNQSMQRNG